LQEKSTFRGRKRLFWRQKLQFNDVVLSFRPLCIPAGGNLKKLDGGKIGGSNQQIFPPPLKKTVKCGDEAEADAIKHFTAVL
jgi:hypothetical protein